MERIKLIPFQAEHFYKIEGPHNLNAEAAAKHPAWSAVRGDRILGAGGIILLWPGVGEAWTCLSQELRENPLSLHRFVKRSMLDIIRDHNLRRIQATVMEGFTEGCKWLQKLGFEFESLLPLYGINGEDFVRYVRLERGGI